MIGTGIEVRVKIQDIVSSQLPEFILSEAPLTDDFLKQFYVSQEFQGGTMDFAANLDQYLNINNFDETNIAGTFFLTEPLSEEDTVVHVNTTKSFPNEWGLLKVDDEILTYTGITTNTFTGVVRGFSGVTSYHAEDDPGELVFQTSTAAPHADKAPVQNLSTLFLKEFYEKIKFTFAPGFENLDFDANIDIGNWIRQARSFYQTKGSAESIEILFRVLYGEDPTVIDLEQFLIKPSEAEYTRRDYAVAIPVEGDPKSIQGRTLFQEGSTDIFGAVSEIEPFTRDGVQYFKIFFFVSNEEISNERKLFVVPGLTKAQRDWAPGDTTVTVDSTIGFRENNRFITADGVEFSYVDRTVNQFLGVTCTDPNKTISTADAIIDDIKVSGTASDGTLVSLRLTGVLSDIDFPEEVPFSSIGEEIRVENLGENILSEQAVREELTYPQIIANSFIYNTSVRFEVESLNGTTFQLKTQYLDKSSIDNGDTVDILPRGSQDAYVTGRLVTNVDFDNSTISVDDSFGVPTDVLLDVRRNQKYATSANTPIDYGNNAILSNVLNLYDAREFDSNFYVATNSLPSYEMNVKIVESTITGISTDWFEDYNSFDMTYATLVFDAPVEFISGDLINYSVQPGIGTTAVFPICPQGEYFVEVLSDPRKIRLFLSPSFIGSENFVPLVANDEPGTHIFTLESQRNREIVSQKAYRTIPITGESQNITIDRPPTPVEPGKIAVLTNGVEVLSYLSADKVFLGPLVKVDPVSRGEGYSVTKPPTLIVAEPDLQLSEPTPPIPPTRAELTPVIKGKLEKILIDPQEFDISKVFRITVTGGNSKGAAADPQVERKIRQIPFDSRLDVLGGGINPNEETIQFLSEHNLAKGSAITYNNRGTSSIGVADPGGSNISFGNLLSNGGIYYAEPVNNLTIRIYNNLEDLDAGINTVGFSSNLNGYGVQSFDTLPKATIVGTTIIEDGGEFWYRSLHTQPSNIVIEYDEVRYNNHGFQTGEVVEYVAEGTPIAGLSTSDSYYVVAEDEDTFKLCNAGVGATSTFNFDRLEFVNFESVGVGTHTFKYPDIKVNVIVSFASTITGVVTATPIIRGGIEQVYTDDGGYYGSDILNFQKNPDITISKGSGAKIKPLVIEGTIIAVQILSKGSNYPDTPDIIVTDRTGAGVGAVLRPVVVDGQITEVIIINGGLSYNDLQTTAEVVDVSRDAILTPRIRSLDVNLQERFGFESLIDNSYSIVSYERTIREDVYNDIGLVHSPIIGWSNDGNPIYGGFGYEDPQDDNSQILALNTGYELDPGDVFGRPSLNTYPAGFFVQDYQYTGEGDLDQYNGRYCRTPEFPKGVYAYFAGISTDVQSLERAPQFPYFIGPEFRDAPITEGDIDQSFNINDKPIFRNTFPYYVGSQVAGSEFFVQSYLDGVQEAIIQSIKPGTVKQIEIIGPGESYQVGDIPIFDTSEDTLSSVITEVEGKTVVSVASSSLSYGKGETKIIRLTDSSIRTYIDPNHRYIDGDLVVFSGLSTNTANLNGPQRISVDTSKMALAAALPSTPTEDFADIYVNTITDNVSIGSSIVIGIGTTSFETVSVIDIFPVQKVLRIDRPQSYDFEAPIGSGIDVIPDFFDVRVSTPDFKSELDLEYFFNPAITIGFGIDDGVGIARSYTVGVTTFNISIPTRSIYAPSHGFRNNEPIEVSTGGAGALGIIDPATGFPSVIPAGNTIYYAANISKDFVGIKTNPSGEPVFFTPSGANNFKYSIKTRRFAETAIIDRIEAIITTATDHDLEGGDQVDVTLTSKRTSGVGSNPSVVVEFDEISQSLIVDPQFAQPAGVNTSLNTITITGHKLSLGDYVLYQNEGTPIVGLETNQKYFVIPFDSDSFKLAKTFEDIKPATELSIDLESVGVGSHKFSLVNPNLRIVVENDTLFDVSSPTLLDTELKFFYDEELTEIFESNGIDQDFVVTGVGTEGLPGGEKLVRYSQNNPSVIYYGLEIGGYISTADTNAPLNNSLQYVDSVYSERRNIEVLTPTSFRYSLFENPEIPAYNPTNSEISYKTSSRTASGGIGKVRIISAGTNFTELPEFITVQSESGNTATLRAVSDDIGVLSDFRIQNPGWGYSADNTLRPAGNIQPKAQFSDSDFVTSIEIIDAGQGYQNPPNAVLIDATTREVIDNGAIELEVQSSSISDVIIELPPTGLSKNPHELYTINNSNGIPILSVAGIDNPTGVVTYIIQTPINGYNEPPFSVGDQVFIENILPFETDPPQVLNMNSDEYGYKFFDVIGVGVSNPIDITVKYPEEGINNIGIAKTLQGAFSSMVNKNIYPTFNVNQATAIFTVGERLSVFDEQGDLIETDLVVEESNTNFFKYRGTYDILPGDIVKGNVSGVIVTITSVDTNECRYTVSSVSRVSTGWRDDIGFLNEETQVTPDNDYYQNLSYSIKSEQLFVDWIGPVNRLVHPAGLKNFADTKITGVGSVGAGFTSDATDSIVLDFIGLTDVALTPLRVDRINVFDLGYDDEINNNRSNAIRFNSRTPNKRLTDYLEVKTNRVLMVDDISNEFIDSDNARGQEDYTEFNIVTSSMTRGVLLVRNPFTDQVQFTEIVVLTFDNNAYTLQKARVSDNFEGYGDFDGIALQSTEYSLRFTPFDIENFDIDYKLFVGKFIFENKPRLELGPIRLGGDTVIAPNLAATRLYNANLNDTAVCIYAEVTELTGNPSYFEIYAFYDGADTQLATYSMDSTTFQDTNAAPVGIFTSSFSGNRLRIDFVNESGAEVSITTKETVFKNTPSGDPIYRFKRPNIADGEERSINLIGTNVTGVGGDADFTILTSDAELFQAVRTVVYIKSPDFNAIHQVMFINSAGDTYTDEYPFITEGNGIPGPGIGTFGSEISGTTWSLKFYPDAGLNPIAPVEITAYHEAFYRESDNVNYRNIPLDFAESEENYYLERYIAPLGPRNNVVRFPLDYQGIPIYEKQFDPSEVLSEIIGTGVTAIFNISDHFFSPAEELYYRAGSSIEGAPVQKIGIVTAVDYLGISTDTLPNKVWAIKRDLNRFSLALSEEDAINGDFIQITNYGLGNQHIIGMEKKLEKSLITIDGVIQAPIATTNLTFNTDEPLDDQETFISLTGIGTIRAGDLLQIGEEYVIVDNVGFATSPEGPIGNVGPFPLVEVQRGTVGSAATSHLTGIGVTLFKGSYNIVESDIVFTEAPTGRGEFTINDSNLVEVNSTFQGRVFLQKEYDLIAVYDDISEEFNGKDNTFTLTSAGSTIGAGRTVGEIENGSGVLIINDIYQTPSTDNNEGNNYFYTYDAPTGINSVTFTGITSANGQRVESQFDVNQNQIPRGGLIVSLGSTPGLGYAPLVPALITPIVAGGSIVGIETVNLVGVTTSVRYADYDEQSGDLTVSVTGVSTGSAIAIAGANYLNENGILLITSSTPLASAGIEEGDVVVLDGLVFSCPSGTKAYPDKNDTFVVGSITDVDKFTLNVGISTIEHTYVSGGSYQKHVPFLFGNEGDHPNFAYLEPNSLEFTCPGGSGITTTLFPEQGDYFPVYRRDNDGQYVLNVGVSTIPHEYVGGGVVGQYTINQVGSGYNSDVNIVIDDPNHTGSAATITGIPGPGGELSFQIGFGGTGYTNSARAFAPDPSYFNLPVRGVFRRSFNGIGTVPTGENLFVTCEIGAATTTAIGKSEYFEVSNFDISNQGYAFEEGDVIEVVGLVTAKGLTQPLEPFQLTVTKIFTDNFAAWNFGELDYIDSIKEFQDGTRTRFPLIYKGEQFSFEQNPADEDSAAIDMNAILLIYVNTVLQQPELNYRFSGGTSFEFTSPPLPQDDIDVYFYRGKRGVDSQTVTDVKESIRPGDELQIRKNDSYDPSKTQNIRTVTEIASSDTVRTNIYFGNDDLDTVNARPVAWDKQKRDIFIYGEIAPKTRDSLESIIKPNAHIIRTLPRTETVATVYVDSPELFEYESTVTVPLENITAIAYAANNFRPAVFQVTVDNAGRVTTVSVVDGGQGYPQNAEVIIAPPPGFSPNVSTPGLVRARVTNVNVNSSGTIQSVQVFFGDQGLGYDPNNPPTAWAATPILPYENFVRIPFINGFVGTIIEIEEVFPTPISGLKAIRFTVEVDDKYELTEIAELTPGDSIVITQTVVGQGVRSARPQFGSQQIAESTEFLDCVYEVQNVNFIGRTGEVTVMVLGSTNLNGIAITGNDLGYLSWGRFDQVQRKLPGEGAITFIAEGPTFQYDREMSNYPTVTRTNEGLRDEGGLAKRL